ncbi:hypothetical protein A2U01_0086293, partial [Trifolium medium]|nr:hypothetical protein [Trifolium medium]
MNQKEIVNNNANEILQKTDAATITDLERQNEDDVVMVIAPERQNDNDFIHSASEEVLEEEIVQAHTDTAHNNTHTLDPD